MISLHYDPEQLQSCWNLKFLEKEDFNVFTFTFCREVYGCQYWCVLGLDKTEVLKRSNKQKEFSGFWREVLEGRMSLQFVQRLEHLKDERNWLIISCGLTNLE